MGPEPALEVLNQIPGPSFVEDTITQKSQVYTTEHSTPPFKWIKVSQKTYSIVVPQIKLKLKFNAEISVQPKHKQYPEKYNMVHLFLEPPLHWITSLCPQNLPGTSILQTHIQTTTILHYKQLSTNFPQQDL